MEFLFSFFWAKVEAVFCGQIAIFTKIEEKVLVTLRFSVKSIKQFQYIAEEDEGALLFTICSFREFLLTRAAAFGISILPND